MPSDSDNSSPQPIDVHRVQSLLLSFGGSFFGAQQLLAGQIVTNPADRQALAQMVVELSNHSRGNGIARYVREKGDRPGYGGSHYPDHPGEGWTRKDGGWGHAGNASSKDWGAAVGRSPGSAVAGGSSAGGSRFPDRPYKLKL